MDPPKKHNERGGRLFLEKGLKKGCFLAILDPISCGGTHVFNWKSSFFAKIDFFRLISKGILGAWNRGSI